MTGVGGGGSSGVSGGFGSGGSFTSHHNVNARVKHTTLSGLCERED